MPASMPARRGLCAALVALFLCLVARGSFAQQPTVSVNGRDPAQPFSNQWAGVTGFSWRASLTFPGSSGSNPPLVIWSARNSPVPPFGSLLSPSLHQDLARAAPATAESGGECTGDACVVGSTAPSTAWSWEDQISGKRDIYDPEKGTVTHVVRIKLAEDAPPPKNPTTQKALASLRKAVWTNRTIGLRWDVFPVDSSASGPATALAGDAVLTELRRQSSVRQARNLIRDAVNQTEQADIALRAESLVPLLPSRIELNFVEDMRQYKEEEVRSLAPFVRHWTRVNPGSRSFTPVTHVGTRAVVEQRMIPLNRSLDEIEMTLVFTPRARESFEWMMQMEASLQMQIDQFGSTDREIEQVKSMLLDTNPFLLYVTGGVAALHILLDLLSFKNDVAFWRNRKDLRGVSVSALYFNVVSQTVVLLYLLENDTSRLVLFSLCASLTIEIWKILRSNGARSGIQKEDMKRDPVTEQADKTAMKLVVTFIVPASICYSIYSLYFHEHFGWYSWAISSLSSVVYGLGFVRMMPQLFINYRLKSVAFMPWRAFTYKFLNTVIDDLFAFVIVMPTMHRVAAFRDDAIFLVFLFQLYIYPVDKSRVNEYGQVGEEKGSAGGAIESNKGEEVVVPPDYTALSKVSGMEATMGFPVLTVAVDSRPTGERRQDGFQPFRLASAGGGGSAKTGVLNQLACFAASPSLTEFASFDSGIASVKCAAFHPAAPTLAVGAGDALHMLDIRSGGSLTPTTSTQVDTSASAGEGEIKCVAFLHDGSRIVCGGADGALRVWTTPVNDSPLSDPLLIDGAGSPENVERKSREQIDSLAISADGAFVYVGSRAGVFAWRLLVDDKSKDSIVRAGSVATLNGSFQGSKVLSRGVATFEDAGHCWLFTGEMVPGKRSWLVKWKISASQDGWSASRATYRVCHRTTHHNALSLSPSGRLLATCTSDGVVALHRTDYLHTVMTIKPHGFFVTSLAFSPDSRFVISAGADQALHCTEVKEENRWPPEWWVYLLAVAFAILSSFYYLFL